MSQLFLTDAYTDALENGDIDRLREIHAETEDWLSGEVQTYTPTLDAATTTPTLGSGSSQEGYYLVSLGNRVECWFSIQFGTSGTNAGSGNYELPLPFPVVDLLSAPTVLGAGFIYDDSLGDGYDVHFDCVTGTDNTYARIIYDGQPVDSSAGTVDHDSPFAWGASDRIRGQLTYIAEDLVI